MTQHISVDLETLGNNPEALILSIGAVKFDPDHGVIDEKFHAIIDLGKPGGGRIDLSTVLWWMKQPAEARDRLFVNPNHELLMPLTHALVEFSEFIGFNDELPDGEYPDIMLWQRGDKDALWLTSAYEGLGIKVPFGFWQWSDQRTLCKYVPFQWPNRDGTHHDALDDAEYQAVCLCRAFESLRNGVFPVEQLPATVEA